jgi:hypothetical protein
LIFNPGVVPVTCTETVQDEFSPIDPPVRDTLADPGVAVTVPLQLFVKPFDEATTNPAGSVSVNDTPVNPTELVEGFVRVIVRPVLLRIGRSVVPNDFPVTGGATTIRVAVLLV